MVQQRLEVVVGVVSIRTYRLHGIKNVGTLVISLPARSLSSTKISICGNAQQEVNAANNGLSKHYSLVTPNVKVGLLYPNPT